MSETLTVCPSGLTIPWPQHSGVVARESLYNFCHAVKTIASPVPKGPTGSEGRFGGVDGPWGSNHAVA